MPNRENGVPPIPPSEPTPEAVEAKMEEWDGQKFLEQLCSRPHEMSYPGGWEYVVGGGDSRHDAEPYAQNWVDLIDHATKSGYGREKVEALGRAIKGKIVVDLGGSYWIDDDRKRLPATMQGIVQKLGARVYINTDKFLRDYGNSDELRDVSGDWYEQPEGMHIIYTQTDIIEFLRRMNDRTPDVVFILNGIDRFVIPGRPYHEAIAKEIGRILPPGGAVLTCGSEDASDRFGHQDLKVAPEFPDTSMSPQLWIKEERQRI